MIKNLIFDFGDVFINLDKQGASEKALRLFNLDEFTNELTSVNILYEQGLLSTDEFLEFYTDNFPKLSKNDIIAFWNAILKDFPVHRLKFIQELARQNDFRLFLLSNTNELHINWIKSNIDFYEEFKSCFEGFYLSHKIQLRKPNADIFNFVLEENKLVPQECLFIDDTSENIITAQNLGFQTWNIDEKTEDVANLFTIKKDLF